LKSKKEFWFEALPQKNCLSLFLVPLCRFSIKQIMEIGTIPTSLKALLKVGMVSWWFKWFFFEEL